MTLGLSHSRTLALLALALLLACSRPEGLMVERIDFAALEDTVPGWEAAAGIPEFASGTVTLRPGTLLLHAGEAAAPVALHLALEHSGPRAAFAAVTRASDDVDGPLGLPSEGVAFLVWDDSVLEHRPFNVEVAWLDGGLLVPIDRALLRPLPRPLVLDVYDDGRWISLAVNGDIMCAAVTPDQPRREALMVPPDMRAPVLETAELLDELTRQARASGTGVFIGAPMAPASPETCVTLAGLTLLAHAPFKTEDEQRRWESTVAAAQLRVPRPLQGRLRDTERDPVQGAVVLTATGRELVSDLRGHFVDTRFDPHPGGQTLVITHPDHPETTVQITDAERLSDIVETLPIEGEGDLTVQLGRADGDQTPLRSVRLRPADGSPARVHRMPPSRGLVVFRNLPARQWVLEAEFADPARAPFVSEPIETTEDSGQQIEIELL